MNALGIPEKINSQVYKALGHFIHNDNGSTFLQIFYFVKDLNRNSKPIKNLRGVVRLILEHFRRIGVIHKDESNRYRLRCPTLFAEMVKMKSQPNPENDPYPGIKSKIEPNIPTKSKRRKLSVGVYRSENRVGKTKRFFRAEKVMKRRKHEKIDTAGGKRHGNKNKQTIIQDSIVPRIISAGKIKSQEKIQDDVNFGDSSTGEFEAHDIHTGDNPRFKSITSLDRIGAVESMPAVAKSSLTGSINQAGSISSLNHINVQDDISKINLIKFE